MNNDAMEHVQKDDSRPEFAGLWIRILAFGLDYLVIALYIAVITGLLRVANLVYPRLPEVLFSNAASGQLTGFLTLTLPIALYFALCECSPRQATPGKRWRKLKVIRVNGGRLSRARSASRTALKFIPWELAHTCIWQLRFAPPDASPLITLGLVLVWVLVGANIASLLISPTHQTLYDRLSGSAVVMAKRPTAP
jgi:uncharacterized RDD family membrane protein YckC